MKLVRWKVDCGEKKKGEKRILSDTDCKYFKDYIVVLKDLGKHKGMPHNKLWNKLFGD
jgi:hypothetical protein